MKQELILPGGDLERAKIAFLYGADAVYVGLNKYSLRKAEVRFDIKEVGETINYAHRLGKRLFVTFNIFAHNENLKNLELDMKKIAKFNPDAFIISDPGVIFLAKKVAPNIPIHLSTQANTVNIASVKFWQSQGVKRIVLARELTLEEIREIHKAVPEMELEVFVHGAMCISYSGRCLLSHYMTGRSANLGDCAQPCRWDYKVYLEEQMRPGEYYPVEESENGTSIMGSKDLRLVRYLPEILEAGVTGLKIEGRNKSEYYLATVGYTYRKALDFIEKDKYTDRKKADLEKELEKLNYRDYTTGFLFGDAELGEVAENRKPRKTWEYVGIIVDYTSSEARSSQPYSSRPSASNDNLIVVKNKIKLGDKIEVLTPEGILKDSVQTITSLNGNILNETNPGKEDQEAIIKLTIIYPVNSVIRKKI